MEALNISWGAPIPLEDWQLEIEAWSPAHPYGTPADSPEGVETKKTRLAPIQLKTLRPWKDIPGVEPGTSGVGYYKTCFNWDESDDGAVLDLGKTYDTARAWINGQEVILDQMGLRADITKLLTAGKNTRRCGRPRA